MKRLKSRATVPPGGFTFIEQKTGLKINEMNFNIAVIKLITHRRYKGHGEIDPVKVADEIEQFVCERVPDDYIR